MDDDRIRCPKCDSTQLHSGMRGWSWLFGIFGSASIRITCLGCGHRFKPGEGHVGPARRNKILDPKWDASPLLQKSLEDGNTKP